MSAGTGWVVVIERSTYEQTALPDLHVGPYPSRRAAERALIADDGEVQYAVTKGTRRDGGYVVDGDVYVARVTS